MCGSSSVVLGSTFGSVLEQDRPQQVLLAQADGGDGTVVELKRRPAVDHHAGVPAARADAHSEETEEEASMSYLTGYRSLCFR